MKYEALIDKLPEYYEKMARTDFTTVFSNIWWALRGPDITDFENHKLIYTLPIRVAMFGVTGGRFLLLNICPSLGLYGDFIEEVLGLKDANYWIGIGIEHYLYHIRLALGYLEELFKGTKAGKVFSILCDVASKEEEFINTGSSEVLRDMIKKLKKIIVMCRNCIHARPTNDPCYVYCKKNRERRKVDDYCQYFEPRLD